MTYIWPETGGHSERKLSPETGTWLVNLRNSASPKGNRMRLLNSQKWVWIPFCHWCLCCLPPCRAGRMHLFWKHPRSILLWGEGQGQDQKGTQSPWPRLLILLPPLTFQVPLGRQNSHRMPPAPGMCWHSEPSLGAKGQAWASCHLTPGQSQQGPEPSGHWTHRCLTSWPLILFIWFWKHKTCWLVWEEEVRPCLFSAPGPACHNI